VAQFYGETAPELELTNLLDDGLLRLFRAGDAAAVRDRLADLIRTARAAYGAELALVTCSSVPKDVLLDLRRTAGVPVLKIDEPMARAAVRAGRPVGVVATFAPTLEPTSALLRDAAAAAGVAVELRTEVVPAAFDALLAGDAAKHDALVCDAVARQADGGAGVIVLAQGAMARVLPRLGDRPRVPVLTSLDTSLAAVREALGGPVPAAPSGPAPAGRCTVTS
jgi:Asp/Glu/hydantoin racemase